MFHTSQQVIDWLLNTTPCPPCDERVQQLRTLLQQLSLTPNCPIITITGTNGKGSTVQLLANILKQAHYRVGSFTSPHLQHYHERICVNGQSIDDTAWVAAANALQAYAIPTHFFSRLLLMALHFFQQQAVDVIVLEVGVGGRLDPCNALDADVLGITRIALDHQDLLGPDRTHIGFEKAGLMRQGRIAIIGDTDVPHSIQQQARAVGCDLRAIGQHFHSSSHDSHAFQWQGSHWCLSHLPKPSLLQSNIDVSLAILEALAPRLPVSIAAIRSGLQTLSIKGRYQLLHCQQQATLIDIAHNPDAIANLVTRLQHDWPQHPIQLVFGTMANKAWRESLSLLAQLPLLQIYICPIQESRGLPPQSLAEVCLAQNIPHYMCSSVAEALQLAHTTPQASALTVVTGSCRLVGDALDWFDEQIYSPLPH